jgi:hypothetical protein
MNVISRISEGRSSGGRAAANFAWQSDIGRA